MTDSTSSADSQKAIIENAKKEISSRIDLFPNSEVGILPEEQEKLKRQIYEGMNPRRRKFVDKIGYEQWDPFQAPKDPLDIRKDITQRTIQQLVSAFLQEQRMVDKSAVWQKAVLDCAVGIVAKDEKYQAIFDFCLWYYRLLKKEGHLS